MGEAFTWGFIAASSLLLGGLLALRRPIGLRPLGLIMAFGAGVLISAVSYELVEDAFGAAGAGRWGSACSREPSPSTSGISPSTTSEGRGGRALPEDRRRGPLWLSCSVPSWMASLSRSCSVYRC